MFFPEPIEKKPKLESTSVVNQSEVTSGSTNKNTDGNRTTNSITDTKDSAKPTNRNSDGNQPTNRITDTKESANRKAESKTNQLHSYATGPPPRSVFPETQQQHPNNIFTTRDTLQGPKVRNYQAPARNEFSNFKVNRSVLSRSKLAGVWCLALHKWSICFYGECGRV